MLKTECNQKTYRADIVEARGDRRETEHPEKEARKKACERRINSYQPPKLPQGRHGLSEKLFQKCMIGDMKRSVSISTEERCVFSVTSPNQNGVNLQVCKGKLFNEKRVKFT